jgi:Leucine-rich repeat (LRR) protein
LAILNLANNEFDDLDFLDQMISPEALETLDVSGNRITQLIHLRFLSTYVRLHTLKVGILSLFKQLQAIEFVKHLCPQLESFDDEPCADVEPHFGEELIDILVAGSETRLCAFLNISQIQWEEPHLSNLQMMTDRPR